LVQTIESYRAKKEEESGKKRGMKT